MVHMPFYRCWYVCTCANEHYLVRHRPRNYFIFSWYSHYLISLLDCKNTSIALKASSLSLGLDISFLALGFSPNLSISLSSCIEASNWILAHRSALFSPVGSSISRLEL